MTGSAFEALDVVVACVSVEKGGGLEEGGSISTPTGGRRMTGSAFSDGRCVGVASRREFIRMGRRSGGGGAKNRTGPEVGGFF